VSESSDYVEACLRRHYAGRAEFRKFLIQQAEAEIARASAPPRAPSATAGQRRGPSASAGTGQRPEITRIVVPGGDF
jgi:hypothetical protein